jgi:hypothetical protein
MLDCLEIQKLFSIKIIKDNKIIRQPGIMSLELAEAVAIRHALIIARDNGFTHIILATV